METATDIRRRRRKGGIARDGERIRVAMTMMDSAQAAVAGVTLSDAEQRQIADANAHAATVQAHADRFDGLRDGAEAERQRTEPAQADYEARIANAWKNPARIGA